MYAELVVEATRVNWSDLALFTQRFYIPTYYCVDYVSENLKQGQGILNEATCPLCRKQKLTKQGNTTFFFFFVNHENSLKLKVLWMLIPFLKLGTLDLTCIDCV